MTAKSKKLFLFSTLKFSVAGLFIPGFTTIAILGIQMGIILLGIECSNSWKILWTSTTIGCLTAPIIFINFVIKKLKAGANLLSQSIIIFNFFEYIFIQCSLAMFFTDSRTLCNVTDGQNGLEFAFTGWFSIPILILISFVFDRIKEYRIKDLLL